MLRNAIESALQQTYSNIQVIVVDDGSTDNTAELVKEYPQVDYILQKHAGQAAARNCGLKNSKGTVIASLDSDDVWHTDFLAKCVGKLEEENLDFVFANWLQYTEEVEGRDYLSGDPWLGLYVKKTPDNWVTLDSADARSLYLLSCPSPSSAVVIRKSIIPGWDETIMIGDDWSLYLDILFSGERRIAFTLDTLWKKRIDAFNIYDGRKRNEVLKYLYVDDYEKMIEKLKKSSSPYEMHLFQKRYMASLVELAKHEMIREHNFRESFSLLKRSFATDVFYTLKMMGETIVTGVNRKVNPLTAK
jgi:glycosyltransferase involved in cell wall biosynthesis